jgi:hypothetical protein
MPLLAPRVSERHGLPQRALAAPAATRAHGLAILVVIAALLGSGSDSRATTQSAVAQEYDLKAAFLFNFAQFVEWPNDAFAEAGAPITIGVLGDDPFGARLDALVAGETMRNRPLVVRRYRSVEQVDACHILFISSSEADQLDQIAKALAHRSILTVGETKDFAAHAGIIGFEVSQRRLRLRINLAAAADARLTISSKLLRQAQIVKSRGGRP